MRVKRKKRKEREEQKRERREIPAVRRGDKTREREVDEEAEAGEVRWMEIGSRVETPSSGVLSSTKHLYSR